MTATRAYHHGDLRRALLAAAVAAIEESGPAALSLRELARRAAVSHAAPTHHFGDKAGLLTALAADGYHLLADALERAGGDLLDTGVAYVRFAVTHRAHFEVMFRPELYRQDDPELVTARDRAGGALRTGVARLHEPDAGTGQERAPDVAAASGTGVDRAVRAVPSSDTGADQARDRLAAWSIVHGFATLWLAGALPPDVDPDPERAARDVISRLFKR